MKQTGLRRNGRSLATERSAAFTIVEMVIVIVVIGILATLILVAYSNVTTQAKVASLQSDLVQAGKQLSADQIRAVGAPFPASLSSANDGNGIAPSKGNTFTYAALPASNPPSYCLQATNGSLSYYIVDGGTPKVGNCLSQGLLGEWKLNGNATDSSGNNNNGTVVGTLTSTTGQNGAANGAYTFNNSYITVSSLSSALNGKGAFSVTGWVKPVSNPASYNSYFGYRNDTTSDFYVLQLTGTNTLECRYRNAAGNFFNPNAPAATITPATWQLVSFTYDGSTAICYVNNIQSQAPASGVTGASTAFGIGATNSANPMTGGAIDDVRLYNRVLSASEIQSLVSAGAQ